MAFNTLEPLLPESDIYNVSVCGIPFKLAQENGKTVSLARTREPYPLPFGEEPMDYISFLGMTTAKAEGCEWWGPAERRYNYNSRVFIGDFLGRVHVVYEDHCCEFIPFIFGVNVWLHEMLEEGPYHAPYKEPFLSDSNASNLLRSSLMLQENEEGGRSKETRYIFTLKTRAVPILHLLFEMEDDKAGVAISAATGTRDKDSSLFAPHAMPDADFFFKKTYFEPMDRLSRRLYQYRDEIPTAVPNVIPSSHTGTKLSFAGTAAADIFTNVMQFNLEDMALLKITEDGRSHTSSWDAPSFGQYVGHGLFKNNVSSYFDHMWSRDVGRVNTELASMADYDRLLKAVDVFHDYLLPGPRFTQRNWLRIANVTDLGKPDYLAFAAGKENDGHAAIMLFISRMFQRGMFSRDWLELNASHLHDAAEWFCWQMDTPEESHFNGVLHSESEASSQKFGGYDLFSNTYAYYALLGYSDIAAHMGKEDWNKRWRNYADRLRQGISERFICNHPRYGEIFIDSVDDCWTWEYKRFAPLFLIPDYSGYDGGNEDPEWTAIARNTYLAQKEDYFSYAAGRQMGYGQGYITQAAILLDEFEDMTGYVEQAALFCYHHTDHPYIVPEGVIIHPSGRFWFRNGDLGNSVQQGEIVKCGRLLLGLDDLNVQAGLRLVPRLPHSWTRMAAEQYPLAVLSGNERKRTLVSFTYERVTGGYSLTLESDFKIDSMAIRIGPFPSSMTNWCVEGLDQQGEKCIIGDNAFIDLTVNETASIKLQVRLLQL